MRIIAVDAGGTSTKFSLYEEDGRVIDDLELSTCHILQVGEDRMVEILKQGVESLRLRHQLKKFYISFGLAGYGGDRKLRHTIHESINDNFSNFTIHSDVEIAYKAAFDKDEGILLISGTGSIAYRKIGKEYKRCGGWGYKLGDEGSGYWIGKKALENFCKEADGRKIKTDLYFKFRDYLKLEDDFDIISLANEMGRKEIASLSKLVFELAEAGESSCLSIIKEAGYELSSLVKALTNEGEKIKVSLVGGVFNSKELLVKYMKTQLKDAYYLEICDKKPVYGAYLYAVEAMNEKINQ